MKKIRKKKIKKIGILGGTFDPPHKGHLYISKVVIKKIKLNKLIWILTKKNPLKKKPYLNIRTRMSLAKKLVKKEKKIFIKYLENKIKSKSIFDLLNYLKRKKPKDKLYFLIGADSLVKFNKWKNWKKIPKLAKIVVFPRQNYSMNSLNNDVARNIDKKDWIYVKAKKINISSSLIRKFW